MKLLTFLGTGNYQEITYVWNGREYATEYVPVASCHFLGLREIMVFLTEEARDKHFETFCQQLPPEVSVQTRAVPKGQNEAELWQVFAEIAEAVKPGEEVAFDITHGLRHFQIAGMLAAAFLRSALDVRVRAVLYGAYEMRQYNRAPMFDLTPLITLLEWATAADRFNRTGDSRYLSSLLREQKKALAQRAQSQGQGDLRHLNAIDRLGEQGLTRIFRGLSLVRPHQVMESASDLKYKVNEALPVIEQAAGALPFRLLLDSIVESYQSLGLKDPRSKPREDLEKQREILRWYADHEHWQQAVTLAREWLLSWFMWHRKLTNFTSREDRSRVEEIVNREAEGFIQAKKSGQPFLSASLGDVPEVETALGLWKSIAEVRNDVNHAGMREEPDSPEQLISSIQSCIERIGNLPI